MECASFPSRGSLPWLCCCLNSKAISGGMLFNLGMPMRRCSWSLKQRDAEFCPTLPHSLRPPEGLLRHVTLKQELVKCKSRIILPCWISLTELFGTASKNRSCSDARGGGRELILLVFFFPPLLISFEKCQMILSCAGWCGVCFMQKCVCPQEVNWCLVRWILIKPNPAAWPFGNQILYENPRVLCLLVCQNICEYF